MPKKELPVKKSLKPLSFETTTESLSATLELLLLQLNNASVILSSYKPGSKDEEIIIQQLKAAHQNTVEEYIHFWLMVNDLCEVGKEAFIVEYGLMESKEANIN